MKLDAFLEACWKQYGAITPDAHRIHEAIRERGETIVNDHVAFRTFNLAGVSRLELGALFEPWGYRRQDDMDFVEKKLKATYWLHPDPALPKIFISELIVEKVSPQLGAWIRDLVGKSRMAKLTPESCLEPRWEVPSYGDYERFYEESEYAAWTAAFGIRVNHFTVLVNALKTFPTLSSLNEFLHEKGFRLSSAGGIIKGTREEGLEQSSTQAQRIPWRFSDGRELPIMSCYYEFAKRYPLKGRTELFQGFIPKSADKIFESTYETKG